MWPTLGGQPNAGSNVIVGDIDTGVWPEHPSSSIAAPGTSAPAGGLNCQFGDGTDVAHLGPTFTCNNKLIGAYDMTPPTWRTNSDGQEFCNNTTHVCSARDSEGHGTHTTTTAAGDCVDSAMLYGVQRGPVCGIAPGARVIEFRVCLASGCFGSDSVSAVQQAINDGVNVINFSISGGANPYSDPVELAFLDALTRGSRSTRRPATAARARRPPITAGRGRRRWAPRRARAQFASTLHLTADGGATLDVPGVTLTNGISSATPVVLAETLPGEDALCQSKLAAGTATGKIVVCQRGTNGRVDKGRRVLAGGAAGMILYNPIKQDLETDNHYLPAIHVDGRARRCSPSSPATRT